MALQSLPAAPAVSSAPEVRVQRPVPFWRALFCDENGIPDEANVAFLAALLELAGGAFIPHFPLAPFAASVCTLIPLYRLSRGDLRNALPANAEPVKPERP